MDRILREEKKYIASICKKIRACGANVLLIQKSILRDAVTDLSLHYLAKMKIMVVTVRFDDRWPLTASMNLSVAILCRTSNVMRLISSPRPSDVHLLHTQIR